MQYPVPAEILKYAREKAKMSQASLAEAMGTVPSVLSKLEKGDEVEPEIADRYLSALKATVADEARAFYTREWSRARPPSFLHPDREALWVIDQAERELADFEAGNEDPILRGPIDLLKTDLRTAEAYLDKRDHVVAWVGDIGVGKTTALTHAVGLLVGDGRSGRRPAFPVGPGRTTVCETAIRVAPTFGVLVDAVMDEEVVRLTRELVTSLSPDSAGGGVSAEVAKLLRNMSGMIADLKLVGDDAIEIDPIVDLLNAGVGPVEVADRMVADMNLADRKERQIILPEGSEDGLLWVSNLVSDINAGLDSRFSLPERITVLMPSRTLSANGQVLSVVDTKGVEGVTQRKDITEHAEDRRTLVVLCSKFADAPNTSVQRHLQESRDAETGAAESHRQCVLVLPRGDEPLEMPGPKGPVGSRALGYSLRRKEVEQALANAGLPPTPVYMFDARNDEAEKIWIQLRGQVERMREVYAERGRAAADGVRNLIQNIDSVRTLEARRDVEAEMTRLLKGLEPMRTTVKAAHLNLITQLGVGHHSSIAASIYRRGEWDNFQFDHILGVGVRQDANLRTAGMHTRILNKLQDLEEKYQDLELVLQSLNGLRTRLREGRQEFLVTARVIGQDEYSELLADADIWKKTAARYGKGSGYKRDIAAEWSDWFDTAEAVRETEQAIHSRLQDAWIASVLEPLRRAVDAQAD